MSAPTIGCAACGVLGSRLCASCSKRLDPGRSLWISNLAVMAAFEHEGTARRLVHLAKYHVSHAALEILAEAMASLVPPDALAVVPIPRARVRRWRYGIDPAAQLAHLIRRRRGVAVRELLAAPLWWPGHAGSSPHREPPRFRAVATPNEPFVLVDDVVTTGATAIGAVRVLAVAPMAVISATISGQPDGPGSDTMNTRGSNDLRRYGLVRG